MIITEIICVSKRNNKTSAKYRTERAEIYLFANISDPFFHENRRRGAKLTKNFAAFASEIAIKKIACSEKISIPFTTTNATSVHLHANTARRVNKEVHSKE